MWEGKEVNEELGENEKVREEGIKTKGREKGRIQ